MRVGEADKQRQERQQRDAQRLPYTQLNVGQKVRVRFLWNYPDGLELWRHERVRTPNGKYVRIACFRNPEYAARSNGHCPYCEAGEKAARTLFWLVWNHETRRAEILTAKRTSYSFGDTLREFWESDGSITDRDWIISRRAEEPGGDGIRRSRYIALPGAPSDFTLPPDVSIPTLEDLVTWLTPRELRD